MKTEKMELSICNVLKEIITNKYIIYYTAGTIPFKLDSLSNLYYLSSMLYTF